MDDLDSARRFFAEEIRAVAGLRSSALVDALARVPRESFLGPGPWKIGTPDPRVPGGVRYRPTPDADPRHLYHNVLVAIDADRALNNGHPSTLAASLDALDLVPGMTMVHIGCGLGYYTAVAATVVGSSGQILAVEIDADLAARAAANLRPWPQVQAVCGDGAATILPTCDALLVNAGFTHPLPSWLDALQDGGRLLVPITSRMPNSTTSVGGLLRVTRRGHHFAATPLAAMAIFASPTGRDPELDGAIRQAVASGTWWTIRRARRDPHDAGPTCTIHGKQVCLSTGA